MSNLSWILESHKSKVYDEIECEFEAFGKFYQKTNKYFVAAHPSKGIWLSGMTLDDIPIPIGLVKWNNIKKIVIDKKGKTILFVFYDFEEFEKNVESTFGAIYKRVYIGTIKTDNGATEKVLELPLELFSGNIIPYLNQKCNVVNQEIKGLSHFWSTFWQIIAVLLIIAAVLMQLS